MRAHAVVVPSPALDHDPGLLQGVEDLPIQQLVPQPPRSPRWSGSHRPRSAPARPARPLGAAWKRSLRAWCLFFDIGPSSFGLEAIRQGGPLQWGRFTVSQTEGGLDRYVGLSC